MSKKLCFSHDSFVSLEILYEFLFPQSFELIDIDIVLFSIQFMYVRRELKLGFLFKLVGNRFNCYSCALLPYCYWVNFTSLPCCRLCCVLSAKAIYLNCCFVKLTAGRASLSSFIHQFRPFNFLIKM